MKSNLYKMLEKHIGNNIEIAYYGNSIAIEDTDTNERIIDTDTYDLKGVDE